MINLNDAVTFAICSVSSCFSFMLICVGNSYLNCTSYHRYDSRDFVQSEEWKKSEMEIENDS